MDLELAKTNTEPTREMIDNEELDTLSRVLKVPREEFIKNQQLEIPYTLGEKKKIITFTQTPAGYHIGIPNDEDEIELIETLDKNGLKGVGMENI